MDGFDDIVDDRRNRQKLSTRENDGKEFRLAACRSPIIIHANIVRDGYITNEMYMHTNKLVCRKCASRLEGNRFTKIRAINVKFPAMTKNNLNDWCRAAAVLLLRPKALHLVLNERMANRPKGTKSIVPFFVHEILLFDDFAHARMPK